MRSILGNPSDYENFGKNCERAFLEIQYAYRNLCIISFKKNTELIITKKQVKKIPANIKNGGFLTDHLMKKEDSTINVETLVIKLVNIVGQHTVIAM